MDPSQLAIVGDASVYRDLSAEYLAQLVAPLDDMWAAFADMAVPHALMVDGSVAGCCCVDDDHQLVRFYVQPRFQPCSVALLELALTELAVARMMVPTIDPNYLSSALDIASSVESHTLLFALALEPDGPGLDGLKVAERGDRERIVDFQEAAIGAPRQFLDDYVGQRLEREEMVLFETGSEIVCVGELRRDSQQRGVAQLGVIVRSEDRGKGIGSRMFVSLVTRSRAEGLTPYCSTEMANLGARRMIERAGFRANHRVLRIEVAR